MLQPSEDFIAIPEVSSGTRRYIPMGFLHPDTICSNKLQILPGASIYHFGVLMSNVHMAWMRTVCGRLKSDYDYSAKIVYNNFPWPVPTEKQKAKIEQSAQAILDARSLYPDCSLAQFRRHRHLIVKNSKAAIGIERPSSYGSIWLLGQV